jgi:hypothetical protein
MGTLKSTRIRTRFSLRSTSVMASLLESDMAEMKRELFSDYRAPIYLGARRSFALAFSFSLSAWLRNRTGPLVPDLACPTLGMATPDPPPNSLGLDIVQPEPTVDAQPTLVSPPSPSPQPTTPLSTNATDSVATDSPAAPTTPTAGTDKVDDATKSNTSKKAPYINPERVRTGGLPRVNLVSLNFRSTHFTVYSCSGQVNRRGARRENGSHEGAKRENQTKETCMSVVRSPCICTCLTPNVRMWRQTRTRSNRLRRRKDSDRRICERYRTRLIAHASKVLAENWTGSRVGNGIPIKNQRSGQRLKSLRQAPLSQLHGPIRPILEIRMRKPKPLRLRNRVRTRNADGGEGGVEEAVEEAAEEGEATEPRRLANLPSRKWRRESD